MTAFQISVVSGVVPPCRQQNFSKEVQIGMPPFSRENQFRVSPGMHRCL